LLVLVALEELTFTAVGVVVVPVQSVSSGPAQHVHSHLLALAHLNFLEKL
jgi:hypothetical protein